MSVPSWMRSESILRFVSLTFDLEKELLPFISNLQHKYKPIMGDIILRNCNDALELGRVAQDMFPITDKFQLYARRLFLKRMRNKILTVETDMYLLLSVCRRSSEVTKDKIDSMEKTIDRLSNKCVEIVRLIEGLVAADEEKWNKIHPSNQVKLKYGDTLTRVLEDLTIWIFDHS